MEKAIVWTEAFLDRLSAFLTTVGSIWLAALVALVNVDVFGRYLLGRSTMVADEYGGYIFVWVTMLGVLHTLRAERFLNVMFVVERLSPRLQNILGIIGAGIGMLVCAILVYGTLRLVKTSFQFGTRSIQHSATPLVWPQLVLPFGFALLCLAYAHEIARRVLGVPKRGSGQEMPEISL